MKLTMQKDLPSAAEVAVEVAAIITLLYWRQDFYLWSDNHWARVDDGFVAARARKYVVQNYGAENADAAFILDIVAVLKQKLYHDSRDEQPFRLDGKCVGSCHVLENGVLDLDPVYSGGEARLMPHSPNLFSLGRAMYKFDPLARAPLFEQTLDWFVGNCQKTRQLLLEAMVYCLLLGLQFQKFFWLVGPGANGKSVVLHVLRHFVGDTNVSAIPLERLGTRFQNAALLNSKINVACDVSGDIDRFREGMVKMLCDSSPVSCERKYHDVMHVAVKTRFWFASNQLPPIKDQSDGFWRRMILIPCEARVEHVIPQFELRLIEELPGILNLTLAAARTLLDRGCFDVPERCLLAALEERQSQNTALLFCDQCVVTTGRKSDFIPNSELYSNYVAWCGTNGHKSMSNTRFGRALAIIFRDAIAVHQIYRTKRRVVESVGGRKRHMNINSWAGLLVASSTGEVLEEVPAPSPLPIPPLVAVEPKKLTAIEREARECGVSPRGIIKQRQSDAVERKKGPAAGATGLDPVEIAELDELLAECEEIDNGK